MCENCPISFFPVLFLGRLAPNEICFPFVSFRSICAHRSEMISSVHFINNQLRKGAKWGKSVAFGLPISDACEMELEKTESSKNS